MVWWENDWYADYYQHLLIAKSLRYCYFVSFKISPFPITPQLFFPFFQIVFSNFYLTQALKYDIVHPACCVTNIMFPIPSFQSDLALFPTCLIEDYHSCPFPFCKKSISSVPYDPFREEEDQG